MTKEQLDPIKFGTTFAIDDIDFVIISRLYKLVSECTAIQLWLAVFF